MGPAGAGGRGRLHVVGLSVARISRPLLLSTSSNSPHRLPETLTRGGAQRPSRQSRAERASAPGSAWAQPAVPALARVVRIASRKGGGESAAVPCGGKSPLLGGGSPLLETNTFLSFFTSGAAR